MVVLHNILKMFYYIFKDTEKFVFSSDASGGSYLDTILVSLCLGWNMLNTKIICFVNTRKEVIPMGMGKVISNWKNGKSKPDGNVFGTFTVPALQMESLLSSYPLIWKGTFFRF